MPKSATLTAEKPKRRGAGSKKTPAAIERDLEVAKEGLPLRFVAGAMGVTCETLQQWKKDPEFAQALESARTEGVLLKWNQIKKAAEKNPSNSWSALAWLLERGFPSEFGRPEVQLGLTVNQTTVNALTITAEEAEKLSARSRPIDAEVDALIAKRLAERNAGTSNTGTGNGLADLGASNTGTSRIREVEAEIMKDAAITLPPADQRHCHWWMQLSRGSGHRQISKEAAQYVIKTIAVDALGAQRASGVRVDLSDGPITLHDLWDALESFGGWQFLKTDRRSRPPLSQPTRALP